LEKCPLAPDTHRFLYLRLPTHRLLPTPHHFPTNLHRFLSPDHLRAPSHGLPHSDTPARSPPPRQRLAGHRCNPILNSAAAHAARPSTCRITSHRLRALACPGLRTV
jgi:hypothetical protein